MGRFKTAGGGFIRTAGGGYASPGPPTAARGLITQSDFTYLGVYGIHPQAWTGGELQSGSGFAHRYVEGQLRFLMTSKNISSGSCPLIEVAAPGSIGGSVGSGAALQVWSSGWTNMPTIIQAHHGLFHDPITGRLWTSAGIDYPDDVQEDYVSMVSQTTLSDSGSTATNHGWSGCVGHGPRQAYGGTVRIPDYFQTEYGVPTHAIGFGGYASRMESVLGPKLGLCLFAIPDGVATGTMSTQYTSGQFKYLAWPGNHSANDWWHGGATDPTVMDRSKRIPSGYVNWYDDLTTVWPGGGAFPSTPPTQWNGAAPNDGLGRWTWGDSNSQNAVWIDTPTKHGFLVLTVVMTGNTWYGNTEQGRPGTPSTLNYEGRKLEWQVYNPAHLGEVALGTRQSFNLSPVSIWTPATPGPWSGGNVTTYPVRGVSFNTVNNQLYVFERDATAGHTSYVHVFQLAA